MKITSTYALILIALLFHSCGSENSEQDIRNKLKDRIESEGQRNLDLLLSARQEDILKELTLIDAVHKNFSSKVCDLSWAKINMSAAAFNKWQSLAAKECGRRKTLLKTFPTLISKHGRLTILWQFNNKSFVDDFSVLSSNEVHFERELVRTRDQLKLSVLSFRLKKNDRFNLYVRTPSLQNSPMLYAEIIKLGLQKSMNVFIEEVRGSRNSEGTFRWFDKKSIKDAEDVIRWIKTKSSQPIIAFGQGYDGMMSLAAGMGREKVQSIISCSSPYGLKDSGYSYDKLKFVWESESGQKFDQIFEKATFIRSQGLEVNRLDKMLFGRKIKDFREYLKSSESYKKKRELGKKVRSIKSPVVHVAGLHLDPTLNGLFSKYRTLKSNNRHAFYLHKDGPGCGELLLSRDLPKYLRGKRRPHISRFFNTLGKHKSVASIDQHIERIKIPVTFNKSNFLSLNPRFDFFNGSRSLSAFSLNDYNSFAPGKAVLPKKTYLNGIINLNVSLEIKASELEVRELLLTSESFGQENTILATGTVTDKGQTILTSLMPVLKAYSSAEELSFKLRSKPATNVSSLLYLEDSISDGLITIPYKESGKKPFLNVSVEKF